MKTAFAISIAAMLLLSVRIGAQNEYTVKLNEEQMKELRSKIISEHEKNRANTMDWARFSRYAKDNAALKEGPTQNPKANKRGVTPPLAVLMGNSITESWAEKDGEWLKEHNIVGRGISGQVSSQMLVRFRQDVIELKPQKVVILCGINDIARNQGMISVENVMRNIISMVELAKANKIQPYLCSVTPAKRIGWRPEVKDTPEQIKKLNELIIAYAKEQKIPYIDYYSALVAEDGESMIAAYSGDGLHPNLEGYKVMEEVLLKALGVKEKTK